MFFIVGKIIMAVALWASGLVWVGLLSRSNKIKILGTKIFNTASIAGIIWLMVWATLVLFGVM